MLPTKQPSRRTDLAVADDVEKGHDEHERETDEPEAVERRPQSQHRARESEESPPMPLERNEAKGDCRRLESGWEVSKFVVAVEEGDRRYRDGERQIANDALTPVLEKTEPDEAADKDERA